jgi:hypothetical protein
MTRDDAGAALRRPAPTTDLGREEQRRLARRVGDLDVGALEEAREHDRRLPTERGREQRARRPASPLAAMSSKWRAFSGALQRSACTLSPLSPSSAANHLRVSGATASSRLKPGSECRSR